jgi:hypothetical protein
VTVSTARLDAEYIGVVHAPGELLEGSIHLVAGRAELVRLGELKAADEAARKGDAKKEGDQSSKGYTE